MLVKEIVRAASCVDLFCGVGGLTHGFVREGLRVSAGIDVDPVCKYPYEANNDARFVMADVANFDPDALDRLFDPGSIKVLAGCAPCQPFSTYSQRYDTKSDGKWALLYKFAELAKTTRPDVLTMENVATLERHQVFRDFVAALDNANYHVWYRVIDCSAYGVPQTRRRMVLLASRHAPIALIPPTHERPKTVKQAIGRLRPIGAGEAAPRDPLHVSAGLTPLNLKRIRASKPGGTWQDWPKRLVAECHRADTGRTYRSVYGRMEWDKPAPTMTTQCYGYGNGRFGHPEQDRAISLREAAMIQSFPRDYRFVEPGHAIEFAPIGRMIGNAVPVALGRAIARSIDHHLQSVFGSEYDHKGQPNA